MELKKQKEKIFTGKSLLEMFARMRPISTTRFIRGPFQLSYLHRRRFFDEILGDNR